MKVHTEPLRWGKKLWKSKAEAKKHLQKSVTFGKLKTELFHIVSCVPLGISVPYK